MSSIPKRPFKVETILTDEAMSDIVTTGLESGCYSSVRIERYSKLTDPAPPAWTEYPEFKYSWWWVVGSIYVSDTEGDAESGVINRKTLQSGLELLQRKWPRLAAQLVSGDYDVVAADALLQCAAFGDYIYG